MPKDVRKLRNSTLYKKRRLGFLTRFPLCASCHEKGLVVLAKELDHIKPVEQDPELFWDESNWQGLCVECHIKKTTLENMNSQAGKDWEQRMQDWDEDAVSD